MGVARVCKCGHNTSDHQQNSKVERTYCLWPDCECKKYEFDHTENKGTYGRPLPEPIEMISEEALI